MLGTIGTGAVTPAPFAVSAQANRVPVEHGHTACLTRRSWRGRPTPDAALAALREWVPATDGAGGCRARPRGRSWCSTAGDRPPQPRRDAARGDGHDRHGRPRAPRSRCSTCGWWRCGHNTMRGAAGASILNAELLLAQGRVPGARGPGR